MMEVPESNEKSGREAVLGGIMGFPGGSAGKESACNVRDLGSILGWEEPLEKGMATHPVFWPGELQGL